MILDRFAARMQPVRLYSNGDTSTILLLRDTWHGLLRLASLVFGLCSLVALLDAADQSGGAAVNWFVGWLILAGLCHVLAQQDLTARRHATLSLRRARTGVAPGAIGAVAPGAIGEPAQFRLYVDGLQAAHGDTHWREFRVFQESTPHGGWLRTKVAYCVVFANPAASATRFSRTVSDGVNEFNYLLIERCLHPEDALRLLQSLQEAAGIPRGLDLRERIESQVNWAMEY